MFKLSELFKDPKYEEALSNSYKTLDYLKDVYSKGKIISSEQRHKLIIKMANHSSDMCRQALQYSDEIFLDSNERIILLNKMLKYGTKYVEDLVANGFIFTVSETDLVIGAILRFNELKTAEIMFKKYTLPEYYAALLTSRGVANALINN